MNVFKLILAAPLIVALAACGADQHEDQTPIGMATAPEPNVTAGSRQATFEPMSGSSLTGEVIVTPVQGRTQIYVAVEGGPPEATLAVRLQSGTCASRGPELAILEAVRTGALGNGRSESEVDAPAAGNQIVAVYGPGTLPERDRPIGCAELPAVG
jgi:hypothetical protein